MILIEWEDASQRVYRAATENFTSAPDCAIAPNAHYPARVLKPGSIARYIWKSGQANGATTEASVGEIVLANADGAYDSFLTEAFDGRPLRVLRGTSRRRDEFTLLLSGTLAGVNIVGDEVTLRVRDRVAQVAEVTPPRRRYSGVPETLEGFEGGLKGKLRPWLIGECENISPPCVHIPQQLYEISCRPISGLLNVWSNGAPITRGVQRDNVLGLIENVPEPGHYDWCLGTTEPLDDIPQLGSAYFALGSSVPDNVAITCHATAGANAGERTAAQVARQLLLAAPSVTEADVSMDAIRLLDAAQSDSVGWWFGHEDDQTLGFALDAILAGIGAGWTPRRDGMFAPARLSDPAGLDPVARFGERDILPGMRVFSSGDQNGAVPHYEVALEWGRNWTVLPPNQRAGSLTDERGAFLGMEYRTATVSNPATWEPTSRSGRHPLSTTLAVTTQLRTEAAAQAEAERLLRMFGVPRLMIDMLVPSSRVPAAVDLGSVIEVSFPRFGLSAGKRFAVTGLDENWSAETTRIEGWG